MSDSKLDDAARAAWLAYVGGLKQDEIAKLLGISRQSAQRLVAQALGAGLVKVRIDHPVARCMELSNSVKERFDLQFCQVVPTLQSLDASGNAVASATGDLLESWLTREDPQIIGLGTGRTLRAAVRHLPHLGGAHHKIVSLTGNITPDGSTAYYNVLFTIADKVAAPTFPMPLPVIAASAQERDALLGQKTLETTRALAQQTHLRVVGIGQLDEQAPLVVDGFISARERDRLLSKGAVGEMIGHVYDARGAIISDPVNTRVSSATLPRDGAITTVAAAHGPAKVAAILGALTGRLITGLITDEATAAALVR